MSKEQRHEAFYTQSEETVLAQLESSRKGLTSTEAQQRLAAYGRNELDEGEKRSLFMKFLDQFKDLMIIILVAAALSFCGNRRDGGLDRCHHYFSCCYLKCSLRGLSGRAGRGSD